MKKLLTLILLFVSPAYAIESRQAGCCSHHGGASAKCTKTGKVICKDKSQSPTCKCPKKK